MADQIYVTVTMVGFSLGAGVDVYCGDTLPLAVKQAREKIALGWVREATPEEVAAYHSGKHQQAREAAERAATETGEIASSAEAGGPTAARTPAPSRRRDS